MLSFFAACLVKLPLRSCRISLQTVYLLIVYAFGSTTLYAANDVHFSGFASIGAGKLDRKDDMRFMDYDSDWSFRSDTILGVQALVNVSQRWSATAQVVSRGFTFDKKSDFEPTLEWLFAKYQWTPETSTRIGRMRTPLYLYSDTLEIGYSYPWSRPPVDTYTFLLSAISDFNGLDVSTSFDLGSTYVDFRAFAGAKKGKYLEFDLEFKKIIGTNFKFHWDNLSIRYGVTVAETDASSKSLEPLTEGYEFASILDPIFTEIAEAHITESAWFQYHGLGLQWDLDSWTLIAEQYLVNGPEEGFANDAIGWYFSISRQMGHFVPYAVVGYYKNYFNGQVKQLVQDSESVVAPGIIPLLDTLREVDLEVIDRYNERGESYTLGIRYDFHTNADIKFELQFLESTALLLGDELDSPDEETLVTSIVLDLVF
ncbi:MAG: hypothetical protein MI867_18130 [Pseudomonadales bacterium]|nr:hypothetical protein [Pseudomonadales bacterium]